VSWVVLEYGQVGMVEDCHIDGSAALNSFAWPQTLFLRIGERSSISFDFGSEFYFPSLMI
jgi:hypothetical protein